MNYEDAFAHDKLYVERAEYDRLLASHDRLLAAAKRAALVCKTALNTTCTVGMFEDCFDDLQVAIAATEELAKP